MSVATATTTLQRFASRFVEELEFFARQSGDGQVTGEQITEAAMDTIRIDLRRLDVLTVVNEFPAELSNLIRHASRNPTTSWAVHRQISMVKSVGGLVT